MPKTDAAVLKTALERNWPHKPSVKVERYVGQFFNHTRTGTKITGQVQGNHGVYTVSIQVEGQAVTSACSCYIGGAGYCHHCAALGATFLADSDIFKEVKPKVLEAIQDLTELQKYLKSVTLDALVKELRANRITQKAFAQSIGMSSRHLSAVKSSELKNRYFHELGATKLACLWVLEHMTNAKN